MTIKMRILIPMIAFTIIASSVVLISDIVQFSHYVESDISNRLNMAALTALSEMDGLKIMVRSSALYISSDPVVAKALENNDLSLLLDRTDYLYANAGVKYCTITDANGIIRASPYDQSYLSSDASKLPAVSSALTGLSVTSVGPGISTKLAVFAAEPIFNRDGNIIGSVSIGFPLDTNEFVNNIKKITGCEVSINQGDTRISTTLEQSSGADVIGTKAPSEISRIVLSGNVYSGRVKVLNDEMIVRYHPIMRSDGKAVGMLFVGHHTDEATAAVYSFVQLGLLFMLLFTVIFVTIISLITGRIVMPINEATNVLREISKGNFDARIAGHYKGDLAVLKRSVNNTAAALALYLKEKIEAEQHANESERAKLRAVEATAIKSEFIASMSHEIRTPMNAIIGLSELLSNENLTPKQNEYVKDIQSSSAALLGIIDDILDMSKIEAGKMMLNPCDFDFHGFIQSIASINTYSAEKKGIDFILEFDSSLPRCLFGDDIRLRQILLNLLSNAIKFTDSGYVRLSVEYSAGIVDISVTDTGVGIRQDDIARLFDSFEQLDSTKNRNKQGTGLGLPITKNLVEMMNGIITVSSVYGQGAVFTVKIPLPLGDISKVFEVAETVDSFTAPDASVLLVDDNEANRKVGCGILKLSGIECDTASDGYEALKMIQQKEYDLVFMDHMMPGMDGIEATERIRGLEKCGSVIIIALTANAVVEAKEMFIACGMNDFLAKPIERSRLVHMLEKWLPREKLRYRKTTEPDAAADENESLVAALNHIDDLDTESGLNLTGDSAELYISSVRIVANRMPRTLDEMEEYIGSGNIERFGIDIHGMKSSMATIGALELAEQASKLEDAANKGELEFCRRQYHEFYQEAMELYRRISGILFTGDHERSQKGESSVLRRVLDEVRQCIDDFDDDAAIELLIKLKNYDYGKGINVQLNALNRQIENFEYEAAVDTISEIQGRIE